MIPKNTNSIDKIVLEKTIQAIKWWNNIASIKAEDPILLLLLKVAIRLIGIVIMIALSPFAILGFILAISLVL